MTGFSAGPSYDLAAGWGSINAANPVERMCQLVPVNRRSFYRSLKEQRPAEEETEVRSVIQQIALEHRRRYGYRRTPRSSAAEACR